MHLTKTTNYPDASRLREAIAKQAEVLPPPTHWPPRLTRMAIAVSLGTTRMLLERRA